MKSLTALLTLILIFSFTVSFSQATWNNTWIDIDSTILLKKKWSDLERRLDSLTKTASSNKDDINLARALYYTMQLRDRKYEDSLYFKNGSYADSIINDNKSGTLLKSIMFVIKAQRLNQFNHGYRSTKQYPGGEEYVAMNSQQLDNLTEDFLKKALSLAVKTKIESIEELLWLSSDRHAFLYKPSLADIIYLERVLLAAMGNRVTNGGSNTWLGLSPSAFISQSDTTVFTPSGQKVFLIYREWMQYQQYNQESYYFIEMQARNFFYNSLNSEETFRELYEQYLTNRLNTDYSSVKAYSVYQLCLMWNKMADQYNPVLTSTGIFGTENPGDKYRGYYTKAVQLFDSHEKLLDSFLLLKAVLQEMKRKIEQSNVKIKAKNVQIPNQPIKAFIRYKNVGKIFTRLVPLNINEIPPAINTMGWFAGLHYIKDTAIRMPNVGDDHQWHGLLLNIGSLPAGKYALMYSNMPFTETLENSNYLVLNITNIAIVQTMDRCFVLNRTTGFPVKGATVILSEKNGNKRDVAKQKVGEDGDVRFKYYKYDSILATYRGDSLNILSAELTVNNGIYDEDEYDDFAEYYEDNTTVEIFTDRPIYRPGQKINFKGIMFTKDPRTGRPIILNKANLSMPFFKGVKSRLIKTKLDLLIIDPFDKKDSIEVFPSEYGSFSGTYTIPANAPTGTWNFDHDELDIGYYNSENFEVEEYKKPGFTINIEKPNKYLALGDSIPIKIKVKSYAGASLQQVKVRYQIEANGDVPEENGTHRYRNEVILDSTSLTNENGEINFYFVDTFFISKNKWRSGELNSRYLIITEATDSQGETIEESQSVYLTNRPVLIHAALPKIIDRKDLNAINISTRSDYGGNLKMEVAARIYRLEKRDVGNIDFYDRVDTWIYPVDSVRKWFGVNHEKNVEPEKILLLTSTIHTGTGETLLLPKETMEAGHYQLELETKVGGNITGQKSVSFDVFDSKSKKTPAKEESFYYLPQNTADQANEIKLWTGNDLHKSYSIYQLSYFVKGKKGARLEHIYEAREESPGLNYWSTRVPENAIGDLEIQQISLFDNEVVLKHDFINNSKQKPSPLITVEQYRKVVVPGEKENFVVSVKTDDLNIATELMTTMYDASLDKLGEHRWNVPPARQLVAEARWNSRISSEEEVELFRPDFTEAVYYFNSSVWWRKEKEMMSNGIPGSSSNLEGRLAGVSFLRSEGLDEVVVTAYGMSHKRELGYSVAVVVRGVASLTGNNNALIVVDGIVYDKNISDLNVSLITDMVILKGADAIAIYGTKGASGVILISTNGRVVIPEIPQAEALSKPVKVRKNFNDLAFFYPKIYAEKSGLYTIQFTMPDNLTEWKWKMLAHTKYSQFAFAERLINSQLKLMVEPGIPKFLYQGDKVRLKTRISNLDTIAVSGVLKCTIEDQANGEDITSQILSVNNQHISIDANANLSAEIELNIPNKQLNPLKIRVGFSGPNASDGEEHLIPVLSKTMLYSQAIPINLPTAGSINIKMPSLGNDAKPYGIGLYIQPKAQASIINSLSYLVDYPWNCAEQTLNKIYARMVAIYLMRTDDSLAEGWKKSMSASIKAIDTDLPGEMDERSMPWLKLNNQDNLNKERVRKLFDTTDAKQQIQTLMLQLKDMQQPDGGFSWFKGGKADPYISAYILNSLGKIRKDSLSVQLKNIDKIMLGMVNNLIPYIDSLLSEANASAEFATAISARSYWVNIFPLNAKLRESMENKLTTELNKSFTYPLGERGRLIIAAFRMDKPGGALYNSALEKLESIRQLSISDRQNGLRWKEISDMEDLNQTEEEVLVTIAEAFELEGKHLEVVNGIIQWLLANKNEHYWTNTKATAEVIKLMVKRGENVDDKDRALEMQGFAGTDNSLTPETMEVTNSLFNGSLSTFSIIKNDKIPQSFEVKSNTDSIRGNINVYYFSEGAPVLGAGDITIKKTIYLLDRKTQQWAITNDSTTFKIADRLRCDITVKSRKLLQYVHIEDRLAASFDVTDGESGYRYTDKFSYYTSVRDASMQFFAEKIPSGNSTISYEVIVSKVGSFSYGSAILTCFYNPSLAAYGRPGSIRVEE